MTRPTDEQIKALKKGDVVLIRATVTRGGYPPRVCAECTEFYADGSIVSIEPRPLAVGDRVKWNDKEWEVVGGERKRASGSLEVALWNASNGYVPVDSAMVERIA